MSENPEPTLIDVEEQITAVIRSTVPMSEIESFFDSSFQRLGAELGRQGVEPQGPAFAKYHGAPGTVADIEVGFVTADPIGANDVVSASSLPAGRVAHVVHAGSFDGLGGTWHRLTEFVLDRGLTPGSTMWEVYVTEPTPDMDPADLRTELYLPVS